MSEKIIIVGNGISGISAIKSIRKIDKRSEIHLFGDEKFYPYNRIRLSNGLTNKLEEDKILLQKKEWYATNKVKLYKDTKVKSINIDEKEITLSNKSKMNYTKLLLANGASNTRPLIKGIDKSGVYTLRTLEDSWDIMEDIKCNEKILNIGAGIQGLEIAWVLSQIGKKVILAETSSKIMPHQLDQAASKIIKLAIEEHGIEVRLDTEVTELYGINKVEGFKTSKGDTINCDMVTYSIGIKPNIEMVKNTNIERRKGIIVNEKMETNIEDVYAAGDIAEFNDEIYGLWNIAIEQGRVAGLNIIGKESSYKHIVPVTTLNAFNISLFSIGNVDESKAEIIISDDRSEEKIYNKVFIKNDKIIGAIIIGNTKDLPLLRLAIEKETSLKGVDYKNVSYDEIKKFI